MLFDVLRAERSCCGAFIRVLGSKDDATQLVLKVRLQRQCEVQLQIQGKGQLKGSSAVMQCCWGPG